MPPIVGILIGVVLLLLLAFAVSYASGWSARPAAAPAEDVSGTLGRERKAQAAIAITLGVGLLLLLYGLNEPRRQAEAFERQREISIERGAHAYAQYCYGCHGYTGTGAIVPGQGIQAANLTVRKATGDRDDDRKLFDFLTKTIARGRPNTPMPAWGLRDGGSLNDEEIAELATFIMYPKWNEIQGLVAPGAPTPDVPQAGGEGVVLARSLFSAKGCTACHTIQEIPSARGNIGPDLSDLGTRAGTRVPGVSAQDYIRAHILQGSNFSFNVPGYGKLMPPFEGQFTPEQLDTLIDYLSKLGTPEQGTTGAAPGAGTAPAPSGGSPPQGGVPTAQPAAPGGAQPNPAGAPGGQVTTPSTTQVPGTSVPIGAPTSAATAGPP